MAIIGTLCLMKPSPSQIYHSDFENESLALSTSTAGCKKFRTKVKAMAPMNKTNSGFSHSADGPRSHTRPIMHAAFLFYDLTLEQKLDQQKKFALSRTFSILLHCTAVRAAPASIFWSFSILEKHVRESKTQSFWTLHIRIEPDCIIEVNVTQCRAKKKYTCKGPRYLFIIFPLSALCCLSPLSSSVTHKHNVPHSRNDFQRNCKLQRKKAHSTLSRTYSNSLPLCATKWMRQWTSYKCINTSVSNLILLKWPNK